MAFAGTQPLAFSTTIDVKYYDAYNVDFTLSNVDYHTACNGGICYGTGLTETALWYGDRVAVGDEIYYWMYHGSYAEDATGIFMIDWMSPEIKQSLTFRMVLTN